MLVPPIWLLNQRACAAKGKVSANISSDCVLVRIVSVLLQPMLLRCCVIGYCEERESKLNRPFCVWKQAAKL